MCYTCVTHVLHMCYTCTCAESDAECPGCGLTYLDIPIPSGLPVIFVKYGVILD